MLTGIFHGYFSNFLLLQSNTHTERHTHTGKVWKRVPRSHQRCRLSGHRLCLLVSFTTHCVCCRFSCVRLFGTTWTTALQVLCPQDSPGKSTGVGCHTFLQGIFLTQGWNPSLLHLLYCRQILHLLSHRYHPMGWYSPNPSSSGNMLLYTFFPFPFCSFFCNGLPSLSWLAPFLQG